MADKRVIEQTASTEMYNDDWFLKDSVVEGTTKISGAILKGLLGADGTQALEEIANAIAEEYDSTHTYSLNDWVYHEGTLYRCTDNNVTGTWDATKWQAKTIKEFIDTAKNSVLGTIEQMFGEYLPISTLDPPYIAPISKGDIFIYQRTNRYKFYRAKADHPQGVTEFDIDDWDEFDTVADLIEDVTENAGKVADVQVKTTGDYETVVDNKIAKIDLSSVTAYGEVPNLPQAIATFKDGADDIPMKSLVAEIEPVQDLHGYDSPWVGGAGKNKLQVTATTLTTSGVTFTVNADGIISTSGTATGDIDFYVGAYTSTGTTYSASGCPSGGATDSTYWMFFEYMGADSGSGVSNKTIASGNNITARIYVKNGTNMNGKVFKPMIEVGSTISTFAPYTNICPIEGWDEVNVTRCGKNWWSAGNRTFTRMEKVEFGRTFEAGNYTFSADISTTASRVRFLLLKGTTEITGGVVDVINEHMTISMTPTSEFDACYLYASYDYQSGAGITVTYTNCQLEKSTSETAYEPYAGTTYTIDLDGTRYGGKVDLISGVLTVDKAMVDLGDLSWSYTSSGQGRFVSEAIPTKETEVSAKANALCSIYQILTGNAVYQGNTGLAIAGTYIWVHDTNYQDATAFKTAIDGVQLVYELATPLTIQLTPTQVNSLLGANNIWADTGDINECIYQRDMNTTINDIIARLEALEG